MRGLLIALLGCVVCVGQVRGGAEPEGKPVLDIWDVAYIQNGKAGYVHTTVREIAQDDQKIFRTTQELHLTVKRFTDTIQLRMDTGTDENDQGKVTGVFMRQYLGKEKKLHLTGTVVGKELRLVLDGKQPLKPAPWNDRVIGMYRQQQQFQERKVKPGDQFTYLTFEPTVNLVVPTSVQVKDFEEVELFGGKMKKRLLRVETRIEKIENVQLAPLLSWLDEDFLPVRSQVEVPGLGQIVLYRTTREGATSPAPLATLTDIGIGNFIRLNKRIPQPYATREMVYRITVKDDEEPTTVFARDERQQVVQKKPGQTFELHVHASHGPRPGAEPREAGDEFLQSSYFINSADVKVQGHARRAVGTEQDPWQKALRIEKWVHDHMNNKNHEAMATADHVARTLEGDCSEYSMLMAAMCRAVGVPSRTAVGLIYADTQSGPVFAFHMWTEVCIQGQWLALDATLGRGCVGATHLKILDHSWHDTRSLTPLLPVLRVLGKVSVEVVSGP